MDLQVKDSGQALAVSDRVFTADFNESLVHQVVTAFMAGGRAGTKASKNRSDVRGGGAKPWKQKGTGRARAGTIRSPLWRTGGVTFAARPRDYSQKLNKKQYRAAMRSILAELLRQDRLILVSDIAIDEPKTKVAIARLADLGLDPRKRNLLVSDSVSESLYLATRNVIGVSVTDSAGLDPVSLVGSDKIVITEAALKAVEE